MADYYFLIASTDRIFAYYVPAQGSPVPMLSPEGEPALMHIDREGTAHVGSSLLPTEAQDFRPVSRCTLDVPCAKAWLQHIFSQMPAACRCETARWVVCCPVHWSHSDLAHCRQVLLQAGYGNVCLVCRDDAVVDYFDDAHNAYTFYCDVGQLMLRAEDGILRAAWIQPDPDSRAFDRDSITGTVSFHDLDHALVELVLPVAPAGYREFLHLHMQQLRKRYLVHSAQHGFADAPLSVTLQCGRAPVTLRINRQLLHQALSTPLACYHGSTWLQKFDEFLLDAAHTFPVFAQADPQQLSDAPSILCCGDDLQIPLLMEHISRIFPNAIPCGDPAGDAADVHSILYPCNLERSIHFAEAYFALQTLLTDSSWTLPIREQYHRMILGLAEDTRNYVQILQDEESGAGLPWISRQWVDMKLVVKDAHRAFQRQYGRDILDALRYHTQPLLQCICTQINNAYQSDDALVTTDQLAAYLHLSEPQSFTDNLCWYHKQGGFNGWYHAVDNFKAYTAGIWEEHDRSTFLNWLHELRERALHLPDIRFQRLTEMIHMIQIFLDAKQNSSLDEATQAEASAREALRCAWLSEDRLDDMFYSEHMGRNWIRQELSQDRLPLRQN